MSRGRPTFSDNSRGMACTFLQIQPVTNGKSKLLWLAKAVSNVAVCQDITWIRGIVFEFLAKLANEGTETPAEMPLMEKIPTSFEG